VADTPLSHRPGLKHKLRALLAPEATPLSVKEKLRTAGSAFLAILLVGLVSGQLIPSAHLPMLVASMGASAVLVFGVSHSPLAQPWPLIGGHIVSALIGVACAKFIPDVLLAAALAVALSVFAMHLLHCLHPPGGAVALIPVLMQSSGTGVDFGFVLAPVGLNALAMLVLALAINNLLPGRQYPSRPLATRDEQHKHGNLKSMDRLGVRPDDLKQALGSLDTFLDISEADVSRIYELAAQHAFRRKTGEITCADIMSRKLVTVPPETPLEDAWALLRFHKIGALPVVDAEQRAIGIVSLVDFLKRANLKSYQNFEEQLVGFVKGGNPGTLGDSRVVREIMASPVFTVPASMHIVELVPLLSSRGLHYVPIADGDDKLVGMVTQSDLIAALYSGAVAEA
jgi:CBS domain-containing membrane protein